MQFIQNSEIQKSKIQFLSLCKYAQSINIASGPGEQLGWALSEEIGKSLPAALSEPIRPFFGPFKKRMVRTRNLRFQNYLRKHDFSENFQTPMLRNRISKGLWSEISVLMPYGPKKGLPRVSILARLGILPSAGVPNQIDVRIISDGETLLHYMYLFQHSVFCSGAKQTF